MDYRELLVRYMRYAFLEGGILAPPEPESSVVRLTPSVHFTKEEVQELQRLEDKAVCFSIGAPHRSVTSRE